jgi:hypothetical protein
VNAIITKGEFYLHINSKKCVSRVDFLDFDVPNVFPPSFQNVHIKFPPCPNAFLICSPSSQDVPKRTTHFNPMTFAQS